MSEEKLLLSTNPQATDAQDAFSAVRDQQRAIGWTGDPSKDHIADQTFSDLDDFINRRPSDKVEETHFDDSQEDPTAIETISMDDLVARWAEADDSNDKTGSLAVQDEIERRLVSDDKMSDELRLKFIDRLVAKKEAIQNNSSDQSSTSETPKSEHAQDEVSKAQNSNPESGDKSFQDKSFKELMDDNPGIARDLLGLPKDSQKPGVATPPPFDRDEFDKQFNLDITPDTQDDDDSRFDFRDRDNDIVDVDVTDEPGSDDFDHPEPRDDEFDFSGGEHSSGQRFDLDPELAEELTEARSAYIRLSAKRRGLIVGRKNGKAKDIAHQRYLTALNIAGQWVAGRLRDNGESETSIREAATEGAINELLATTGRIYGRQVAGADSKRLKPFYEKWASWGGKFFSKEGLKGNAKKMLTIGAITAVPALALGVFGAAFLGAGTIATLTGVGSARGIGRNLMGAKIERNSENVTRVAGAQLDEQLARDESRIRTLAGELGEGEYLQASDVTEGIEDATARDISRNRKRTAKAAITGATLGAVGGLAVANIFGLGGGGGNRPSTGGSHTPGGSGGHAAAAGAGSGSGRPSAGGRVGSGTGKGGGSLPAEPKAPTEPIPNPNGPGVVHTPSNPNVPVTPGAGADGGLPELIANDGRSPWIHVTEALNNGNGSPNILAAVDKGRQLGFKFNGETVPGLNNDRILSVTTPNGITYADNGHINAALDYIMAHEA